MTGNRFINAMSMASYGWMVSVCCPGVSTMAIAEFYTIAIKDGPLREEDNSGEEDDFDALLAASSFGSEQARTVREQTPPAVREHARRVLDGQEKRAPAGADVDDAVSGLVYGLARGVVPGPAELILASSTLTLQALHAALSDHGAAGSNRVVVVAVCQTSMLWPDHRARLLQALIDHDAFASLRHDVAWKIIDWTFDVPRPPRVLRQCAALAIEQIDISALACTWLAATRDEAAARSCMSGTGRGQARGRASAVTGILTGQWDSAAGTMALQGIHPQQKPPPALDAAPPRAALTAGPTRQTIADEIDTPAAPQHSARRVPAHTRRLPSRRRTAHRGPSAVTARKASRTAAPYARRLAIAVIAAAVVIAGVIGYARPLPSSTASTLPGQPSIQPLPPIPQIPPQAVGTTQVRMPSVVLFGSNSAALQPGADAVLGPIAHRARSLDLAVSITGYASPDGGTSAYNLALSAWRAAAVRDRLIALGLPAEQVVQVTGVGTAGESRSACFAHGHLDEVACAQLRRVVILLLPVKENP